ncbi:nucleotidyl transferase AbiEii/AbiGii toxin family protein [Yinghuangia soli]|uniref:Nucleotidyl transferase AbiEii/AbiGii toxin family protein n=1 Tax=Yinghuangia soli TaxID=2908204 RepID=A0AA41U5S9_9ACTN|nr:nucleotidyl transferase AbiEii/AbiGii toxin family protein [Yinghuangia soli]MCF2530279.1 nucleotidyl transferase AbiEii/AbiGii toxin family protein [Yinghuangia soli]
MADAQGSGGAQRAALDHVLALIAESPWADQLVLRGSMAMLAWAGDRAREPADLDWIVVPGQDAEGPDPVADFVVLLRERPDAAPGVRFDPDRRLLDGLGQYYTAGTAPFDGPAGLRLAIPWTSETGERGWTRIDFAHDEPIHEPPVQARIPRGDGGPPTTVQAASPELSLAWKLQWLQSDATRVDPDDPWQPAPRAQGKDLYDAVLLAEAYAATLSGALLARVMGIPRAEAADRLATCFDADAISRWDVDWRAFQAAHPHVRGGADAWLGRLARAVAPILYDL